MHLDADFWDNKYQNNDIGWDIGEVSTPLKAYFQQLTNTKQYILIPGGGNSYEARYLHSLGFKNVFVVDLSETALNAIQKSTPNFPKTHLIQADFFKLHELHPNLKFDIIIEQTFFCAINPTLRSDYVTQTSRLLKENGKVTGVLFDAILNTDIPPFGGNKNDYLMYFKPFFTIEIMETCYNSISNRSGRELFIKLVKR